MQTTTYTPDGHLKLTLQECISKYAPYCKENGINLDLWHLTTQETYAASPTSTPTTTRRYCGYIDADGNVHLKK